MTDIVERLRDCANGSGDFKTDRGDFGLCDDAADEIERLRGQGWRPIETAPKDGRRVLLHLRGPYDETLVARWYAPWSNWQAGSLPSDPAREEHHGIGSLVPSHWMPLPESPP